VMNRKKSRHSSSYSSHCMSALAVGAGQAQRRRSRGTTRAGEVRRATDAAGAVCVSTHPQTHATPRRHPHLRQRSPAPPAAAAAEQAPPRRPPAAAAAAHRAGAGTGSPAPARG
jgi:hypothetical protein